MERSFLFLVGSTRAGGNTESLARIAAEALPPAVPQRWLRLDEHALPAFADVRHAPGGAYAMPDGAGRALLDATLGASDLVFVVPTYWYSLPAAAKLYLDHWSAWMRVPGLDFLAKMKGRGLWAITVNADEPELGDDGSAPLVGTLERTAAYMEMLWRGALVGHGNRPGDVLQDAAALAAARTYFAR